MKARFFAIQQKSTGNFMPASKRGRGFTCDEPTPIDMYPPRLFTTEQAARMALAWWLKGETTVRRTASGTYEGYVEYDEDWETTPVPERSAADMQIVTVDVQTRKLPARAKSAPGAQPHVGSRTHEGERVVEAAGVASSLHRAPTRAGAPR